MGRLIARRVAAYNTARCILELVWPRIAGGVGRGQEGPEVPGDVREMQLGGADVGRGLGDVVPGRERRAELLGRLARCRIGGHELRNVELPGRAHTCSSRRAGGRSIVGGHLASNR